MSLTNYYLYGVLRAHTRIQTGARALGVYFLIASFAPQTEHLPSAVIFGCSATSPPQSPHFTKVYHLQRIKRMLFRDIYDKTFVVACARDYVKLDPLLHMRARAVGARAERRVKFYLVWGQNWVRLCKELLLNK